MAASHDSILDPQDRAYVEQLEDADLREVVVASLQRHRRPERLDVGDPAPEVSLIGADDGELVALGALLGARPVVLVFGSYT